MPALCLANFTDFLSVLTEGVHDPGILKCVFMAGGPGSGKSHVAGDLFGVTPKFKASFSAYGLKLVNSDTAFEHLLAKHGVNPKDLHAIERDDPAMWNRLTGSDNSVRQQAKRITNAQKALYMQGKLGLIVDGTGDDVNKIASQKDDAESAGYDTLMVFVATSLDTALSRNRKRARQLPDSLVTQIWQAAQDNLNDFADMFGRDFLVINNDNTDADMTRVVNKIIAQFIRRPVQNPLGREWMQVMSGSRV